MAGDPGVVHVAGRRPTRQEVNRRHERSGFVGRRGELAVFRETFARDPEAPDFPFLFHVRGNGGVGKSTLVRQWESTAREQTTVVTAFVDDDVHDAIEAMEAVSARLARQGYPLKRFDKQLATYRQRRHQAESTVPAPQPDPPGGQAAAPAASPSSTVATQVGLVGLGMVPGVGAFVGAVDPQQIALGADRVRAALNTRLRSHDDVRLVMDPVAVLAPVFLEDLAEVAERCERVVLFFDVYERTGPVLDAWLHDIVFGEEYGGLPVNVQVVLSGRPRLDTLVWGDRLGQVTEVCLEVFTEEEARTLLATHGVTDKPSVELVLRLSGRLPLLVDMLARSDPGRGAGIGDPSETAVERFLKWERDAERREAALACALPLQIDEDIYRTVVPEAAARSYAWLRGLAFVSSQAGRCRYHDVVRAAMLRLQRTRSPARWQQAHTRLADLFQGLRSGVEADIGTDPEDHWRDAAWREHRLNETYHRLCAHPRTALPDALCQSALAVDHDAATLRAKSARASSWRLLRAPGLDASGRALVHAIRAAECRGAGDEEGALADCEAAVALAPDMARGHAELGDTYRILGRHEEAVASCTRAVEIDPGYVLAYGSRADAYRNLGAGGPRSSAVPDPTPTRRPSPPGAVELDPEYAWAYGSRARVHEAMGRQEEALADYDRAVGIDPLYEWAIGSRAQLFERMGRHEEALADYGRAVELDPEYAWAYGSRARVHEAMGRQEEALADYDRAVGIDPLYEWAIGSRAQLFERMGRHEEALADYGRAVEIDPEYAWAYGSRAQLLERMGRHEEALADYGRAVEIDPEYAWAHGGRARVYEAMGRHEEALADLARAVEIDPLLDWVLNNRAGVYLQLGRYADAVADYARTVESGAEDGRYQLLYGLALRGTGDDRAAETSFGHAMRIFTAEAEGDGVVAVDARQGLLVLACAQLDAASVPDRCEVLVGLGEELIRETIVDLALLRELFPETGPVVEAAALRLREAL